MRFTLITMVFERPWLTTERVARLQSAFEQIPPPKGGDGDPLRRYRPGMILDLYTAGSGVIYLDGPVSTTTGFIGETRPAFGRPGEVSRPGETKLHLHSEDLEVHRELGALARWLGTLPEMVLGSWVDLDMGQATSEFTRRGIRRPMQLNRVGLPLLSTHTFYGAQLVDRIGVETLQQLQAEPYGEHGGAYVRLDPGDLSSDELIELQARRSQPLVDTGLVADDIDFEGESDPGPAWTPLQFSVERLDES